MIIIGAGLAGLIAGNLLARHKPALIEAQPSLPNNHSAVLRFKTAAVGDALNIPFKKVSMIKTTAPWRNPVADALAYAYKNSGMYRSDRSIVDGTVMSERYIAPGDLIARLASDCDIRFNTPFNLEVFEANQTDKKLRLTTLEEPIISTIPMPALMKLLDYPHQPEFTSVPGINIRATIEDCDAYVSLLVPDPSLPFSRISITGNELIIECPGPVINGAKEAPTNFLVLKQALLLLGIDASRASEPTSHHQQYAKINPIGDDLRKRFIIWSTDNFGIFSLGRFATWRPHLLADHLPKDLQVISRLIQTGHAYEHRRDG